MRGPTMTDPLKKAMFGITDENRARIVDMVRSPALDTFYASPAIQDLVSGLSTKHLFTTPAIADSMIAASGLGEMAKLQIQPAGLALTELASMQVQPFRDTLLDAMPDITAMWQGQIGASSSMVQSAIASIAVGLPEINLGIKEVLNFNSVAPVFDTPVIDAMRNIIDSPQSWLELQTDVGLIAKAMCANSDITTLNMGSLADTLHSTTFADAMQTLVPQIPVIPDVSELIRITGMDIDLSYLDRVADQLSGDRSMVDALKTATSWIVDQFKVSRETARKAVLIVVWLQWMAVIMGIYKYCPEDYQIWVGTFFSGTSLLSADKIATKASYKIVSEK